MSYDVVAGRLELANVVSDLCKKENYGIIDVPIDPISWFHLMNRQMIFDVLDFDDTYGFFTTAQRNSLESTAKAVVNLQQYL